MLSRVIPTYVPLGVRVGAAAHGRVAGDRGRAVSGVRRALAARQAVAMLPAQRRAG